MKSKKTTGLFILVILIWGTIGYRVYEHFEEEEPALSVPVRQTTEVASDTTERLKLSLDYPDPFLKTISSRTSPRATTGVRDVKNMIPRQSINAPHEVPVDTWDKFQYIGSIYNATRQSYHAMIKITGVEYTPKTGDVVNDFKIVSIKRDSIEVQFGNVKKTFKKKKDL